MLVLLAIWAALVVALIVFAIGQAIQGGALTLAYFLGLSLIHVPGVLPFLGAAPGLGDGEPTLLGLELTVLGMACFVAGAITARAVGGARAFARAPAPLAWISACARVGWRMVAAGAVTYFVLIPFSFKVPSLTAAVSAFATLLILGLWLLLYRAVSMGDHNRVAVTLALLPLLPLATLVTGGFLGYGTYWVLSVITFLFVIARRRFWFYFAAPVVVFVGLSLFVTYMGQRAGIRELVWEQRAGLVDRLDRISTIGTEFQLLDLGSPEHVEALNGRLNQNWLVGAAVRRHEDGLADFAYGGTVPLWAFIPRAIWSEKPVVGGGGQVVSDFTGIQFGEGTSVGAGQVLEFYVNFGILGVVIGFLAFGFALMRLDYGIMRALSAGDTRGLVLRAMPGFTLLQPGGNLLEMVVALVAALLGALLVSHIKFFDISTPRAVAVAAMVRVPRVRVATPR